MPVDEFDMDISSPTPDERARKATSLVLKRLQPEGTQKNLAVAFGVSEPTITRWKDSIEPVMKIVAQLGLKVVPAEMHCYKPEAIWPFIQLAKQRMKELERVDQLRFEDDEA